MQRERRAWWVWLALATTLGAACTVTPSPTLLRPALAWRFPRVSWIDRADLARHPSDVLILDVRSPAEFAVSHLRGAQRIDPDAAFPTDETRPVVAYCSVGWRSAAWLSAHAPAGRDARNLVGGIFGWANDGRELVRGDGERAHRVHPFDERWALFLRDDLESPANGDST